MNEDNELIRRYLDGEGKAFTYLMKRYLKSVYNFSFWLTQDGQLSNDVTQESFLKVWKSLEKFNFNHQFKPWLFSIVRNTAVDFLRKNKNIPISHFNDGEVNFIEETFFDENDDFFEEILKEEDHLNLKEIINKMDTKYKEVIILHSFEGLKFEEISSILKRPVSTVKSQYQRGLVILKKILK